MLDHGCQNIGVCSCKAPGRGIAGDDTLECIDGGLGARPVGVVAASFIEQFDRDEELEGLSGEFFLDEAEMFRTQWWDGNARRTGWERFEEEFRCLAGLLAWSGRLLGIAEGLEIFFVEIWLGRWSDDGFFFRCVTFDLNSWGLTG